MSDVPPPIDPALPPSDSSSHPPLAEAEAPNDALANSRVPRWFSIAALVVVPVYLALWFFEGIPQVIAAAGLEVLPFLPLVVCAQLGQTSASARLMAMMWWFILTGFWFLVVFVCCTFGAIDVKKAFVDEIGVVHRAEIEELVRPDGIRLLGMAALSMATFCFFGFLCFTPLGRRTFVRWLGCDPNSFSDVTVAATYIPLMAGCLIPLILLNEPPLLLFLREMPDQIEQAQGGKDSTIMVMYLTTAWVIPFAIIYAGFPLTRKFGDALRRLGLAVPSVKQILVTLGLLAIMVPGALILDKVLSQVWQHFGWPRTDEGQFRKLLESSISVPGAIAIGVFAGISEELAFRGLLQPKVGLIAANALFAGVHAFQYHWDGVVAVFLIGAVCGLVRKSMNTTCSIILHGTYDFVLVLGTALQWQGF